MEDTRLKGVVILRNTVRNIERNGRTLTKNALTEICGAKCCGSRPDNPISKLLFDFALCRGTGAKYLNGVETATIRIATYDELRQMIVNSITEAKEANEGKKDATIRKAAAKILAEKLTASKMDITFALINGGSYA